MTTVKASSKLTLRDRLSQLTYEQACKLLGPEGKKLIQWGGKRQVIIDEQVYLGDDLYRQTFPAHTGGNEATVTITLMAEARDRLHWHCDRCETACEQAIQSVRSLH